MWRYYNITIQSQNPNTYGKSLTLNATEQLQTCALTIPDLISKSVFAPAFIRMGDLFYERHGNRQKNLFSAAQMYTLAALRNNPQVYLLLHYTFAMFLYILCAFVYVLVSHTCHFPQGWYNLGVLGEEGYKLPLSILIKLGISELYLADKELLLNALYKRFVWILSVLKMQLTARTYMQQKNRYFFPKDAETRKMQTHSFLAALPSSVYTYRHFKSTIALLLR